MEEEEIVKMMGTTNTYGWVCRLEGAVAVQTRLGKDLAQRVMERATKAWDWVIYLTRNVVGGGKYRSGEEGRGSSGDGVELDH